MRITICSDEPWKRYDWFDDSEYWEVLDHSQLDDSRVRLNGIPFFYGNDRTQFVAWAQHWNNDGHQLIVDSLTWSEKPFWEMVVPEFYAGQLKPSICYELLDEGKEIGQKKGLPVLQFAWRLYAVNLLH